MNSSELWSLIWGSLQPVLKLILLSSIGAIMARNNVLDYKGRKTLSSLCWLVFLPCLNFTSIAPFANQLLAWWPLVVNLLISLCMGAVLGYLNIKAIRTDEGFKGQVIASITFVRQSVISPTPPTFSPLPSSPSTFITLLHLMLTRSSIQGNVGNLPLVIVSTLASSSSSVLRGMDKTKAEALAVAYISIGCVLPSLLMPLIGYRLLAKKDPLVKATKEQREELAEDEKLLSNLPNSSSLPHSSAPADYADEDDDTGRLRSIRLEDAERRQGQRGDEEGGEASASSSAKVGAPMHSSEKLDQSDLQVSKMGEEESTSGRDHDRRQISISIQPSLSPSPFSPSPLSPSAQSSLRHPLGDKRIKHDSSITWMLSRYSPEFMSIRRPKYDPSHLPLPLSPLSHSQYDQPIISTESAPCINHNERAADNVEQEGQDPTPPVQSQPSFVASRRLPPPLLLGLLGNTPIHTYTVCPYPSLLSN